MPHESQLLGPALGLLAALGNAAGGAMVAKPWHGRNQAQTWSDSSLHALMQLGAGFLLAVTVVEIMPVSIRAHGTWGPILILAGYLLIHLFEHTVAPHFHFGEETHREMVSKTAAYSALFGLSVHSLFDGVAIGAAVMLQGHGSFGLLFVAILLHKIPEGATSTSIALAAGLSRKKALMASVTLGLATVVGVGIADMLSGPHVSLALALAAGVTLYVAATDLIPHGNAEKDRRMPLLVFAGVALFIVTDLLLQMLGIH